MCTVGRYRSGTVNSNTVNSKIHLIRIFYQVSVNIFFIISCLKCTVNSNFHLIRSKTLPRNDFELTVPDLYNKVTVAAGGTSYRSGTINSNTVNSKFHLIRIFYEVSVNIFYIISCLKCTVNSNFHLIRSKTLPTQKVPKSPSINRLHH